MAKPFRHGLPVIAFYLLAQQQLIAGLTAGAVKG